MKKPLFGEAVMAGLGIVYIGLILFAGGLKDAMDAVVWALPGFAAIGLSVYAYAQRLRGIEPSVSSVADDDGEFDPDDWDRLDPGDHNQDPTIQ